MADQISERKGGEGMNAIFAEATTSTAFLLALSKRQCNTLLRLRADKEQFGDGYAKPRFDPKAHAHAMIVSVDSLSGLLDRGLVFWHQDEKGQNNGFGGMTKAGELVADLLVEAGMTIEGTNTLSVLKRIRRAA